MLLGYFWNSASLNSRSKMHAMYVHITRSVCRIHLWRFTGERIHMSRKPSSCNVTKGRRTMTNESLCAARIMLPVLRADHDERTILPVHLFFIRSFLCPDVLSPDHFAPSDYDTSPISNKFNIFIVARISYFRNLIKRNICQSYICVKLFWINIQ